MADRTTEESRTISAGNKENAPDAESTPAHASDDPAPAVGFFERLRHHKVAQWTLAYAAGAYTLLHAVEMVSGALGWPHLVVSLTTLVLFLGFPVVITLAWYHGHRARQRVSGAELAILTLLLALGGGLLWLYGQRDTPVAATSAPPAAARAAQGSSAASADERPSVAVLPFENRSRLEDDVFFVDGIHDDILTQLSKVSALKVISRTSVEKFRDTPLSTQEIAGQLGVTSILEGGVQRVGDRVRIHVQLIDAGTDAHLWAESYDRELSAENIFAIQTEVAVAIAGALKTTLTAGERTRMEAVPTQNLQAWENYQLGRQRFAKRTGAGFTEAERYFQKAVELDPNFALAYCGLADSLAVSLDYTDAPRAATLARAQAAVDTALKLDPELADAWVSAGQIESYRDHRDRAEAMFRRAVELDPNHAMARKAYGLALRNLGRFVEGVAQLEQAARLDPLSAIVRKNLGQALEAQGRFRDAASQYRKAIEIDPLMPGPYQELALLAASAMNHYAAAVPLMARAVALDPDNPYTKVQLAALYWDLGDDAAFDLALREAEQRWPDKSMVQNYLALRDLQLQDLDGAARHAKRALDLGPDNRLALLILGWIDVRLGRYPAAAERYRKASPELFSTSAPRIDLSNWWWAYELVPILQKLGEDDRADAILKGTEDVLRKLPRLAYAPTDAVVLALRGRKREALEALRSDHQAGWREDWRFYRDIEPSFDSIRDDPEFKAIFADIERDMARQRAELAKQPEDAPLDLEPSR